ncbi:MAG: hypothetical protein QOH26_1456 [Actinomycetota bacterium]|jgi:hypothetical protein|nr:hypothetical protein [Actinomycetota bacterium]
MTSHIAWHILVLGTTLMAAAGAALLLLAPLLFEEPPPGLVRSRPLILGLVAVAVSLLLVEWLGIH